MSKVYYEIDGLKIEVIVCKERAGQFGRVDVLIVPVAGSGEKWVYKEKLLKSDPNLAKKIVKNSKQ